ncbi:MAG: phosphotransferase [Planctomycetes bacterium]|nr:phosphotransferase [Planctomycetota bacterium]
MQRLRDGAQHERCGAWHVVRALSRGGMGETFEVEHSDGRRGVLKRVRASLGGAPLARRFREEQRVLARLDLDCVPRLYECGEDAGQPFLVQAHVPGVTLRRALESRLAPLDSEPASAARLALALSCIDVAARVQQCGVVHGDWSPENLMLTVTARAIRSTRSSAKLVHLGG